jgi:hypothetical protein
MIWFGLFSVSSPGNVAETHPVVRRRSGSELRNHKSLEHLARVKSEVGRARPFQPQSVGTTGHRDSLQVRRHWRKLWAARTCLTDLLMDREEGETPTSVGSVTVSHSRSS